VFIVPGQIASSYRMEVISVRIFLLTFIVGAVFALILVKLIYRRKCLKAIRSKDPYAIAAVTAVSYFIFLEGILFFCNSTQAGLGYVTGVCLFQRLWR